ncbi:MAG TPA: alpha/beta fold hydrolase [Desulfopila sp.]|nr:alpha/beta fold hydrolase [Desulfopila sp.]
MNRSAYFTTGFAIKALANLTKADVVIHGKENIPAGPAIFVVNHFTRLETLLLPYHINNLTGIPAFSLADDSLFRGALRRVFDMIGVISTKDPNRDNIIIKGLLTGTENWIIFPEGRMVKTKKMIGKGRFLIQHEGGSHKPHTGAASLALRTEFFRRHVLLRQKHEPLNVESFLHDFGMESVEEIRDKKCAIVPVNLTYYPIRAKENIASYFATRMMKEVPDIVLEELMTEGTMLLSGVDLNIRFGQAIALDEYLADPFMKRELQRPLGKDQSFSDSLNRHMRKRSMEIMQRYMQAIYNMTTVNHEHLFASFLIKYPFNRMSESDLRRRVYLAATYIRGKNRIGCSLHKSLEEDQTHLLTDDRFKKSENFLKLAKEKNILHQDGDSLIKVNATIPEILTYNRGRIDNTIHVIANEVEPLKKLQRLIWSVAWQPAFLVRARVVRTLLEEEQELYKQDCLHCGKGQLQSQGPFLLRGSTRKVGVVLVHSYLSVPEEVRELAVYLQRRGLWVYAPRLAGHGTTPEDLAQKTSDDWRLTVDKGYAVMGSLCKKVAVVGVSIGGCLALDLAARLPALAGVVAVCPPLRLSDYSSSFMPSIDVWQRILARFKRNDLEEDFFRFTSENEYVNYDRNPIAGVKNVGLFLENLKSELTKVRQPCLILHADKDPVVSSGGGHLIYENVASEKKEFALLNYDRHIIVRGPGTSRVHQHIESFIRNIVS